MTYKTIRAEYLQVGDYLVDEGKYIEEIQYRASSVVLRTSYTRGNYPVSSLMIGYDETMRVL